MRSFIRFYPLIMLACLLNAPPLPAQNAEFVVAPSGAERAEQGKTSNYPQNLLDPHGEMLKGITTNTTTSKLKAKIMAALERAYRGAKKSTIA